MARGRSGTEGASSVSSMQNITGSDFPELDPSQPAVSSQQSLAQAVHARRTEYTRPHTIRIKVGTWNVAAKKGTEEDIGGWFVGGKGVSAALNGLDLEENRSKTSVDNIAGESVRDQEARRNEKEPTIPKFDPSLVAGGKEIGLYVLGLQEIVDISSATEALRPYTDTSTAKKWTEKIEESLPAGYKLVAEEQLIGLLLLTYASPEVLPHVRCVSTTNVGTGLMGYVGNKGAVCARLVLGETTRLIFINAHMSAGVGKAELQRRNWDASQILSRAKFTPVVDTLGESNGVHEKIGDEHFAFWFGDLNYRLTDIPGDDVRRLLLLHMRNEYDVGQPPERRIDAEIAEAPDSVAVFRERREHSHSDSTLSTDSSSVTSMGADSSRTSTTSMDTLHELDNVPNPGLDPTSLQATLESLLTHDELFQQQKQRRMFHDGWREGPITFVPTYKYDVGSVGVFDSTEKRRAPSWCDRILFRTRNDRIAYEERLKEEAEARKRDAHLKAEGLDKATEDEDTLFDYDPEADGEDGNEDDDELQPDPSRNSSHLLVTKDGVEDSIELGSYVSHQRVISSDHKPLDSIFTLKYDAVVPELRSKVHDEVAKELDKAENEGRPLLTVVIDGTPDHHEADFEGINFGEVCFNEYYSRVMTVANTGRVAAYFGLADRPAEPEETRSPTPTWLDAHVLLPGSEAHDGPRQIDAKNRHAIEWEGGTLRTFLLNPGDTCTIELTIQIDAIDLVKTLNKGQSMEDILVLRVKEGKDHFIPVRGFWQKSIFGQSIDGLARLPEGGIRALQKQENGTRGGLELTSTSSATRSAPVEIFRLSETTEGLVERIVAESNMLRTSAGHDERPPWMTFAGWPFAVESWTSTRVEREELRHTVVRALESGQLLNGIWPDDSSQIIRTEVLAETLLMLLRSLEDGVITEHLWVQLEQNFFTKDRKTSNLANIEDQKSAVLEIFSSESKSHSASFIIITSMLARMIQEIVSHSKESDSNSHEQSSSPIAILRRRTLDRNTNIVTRQSIQKAFAAIFADAMIQTPSSTVSRAKKAIEDQKRELLEIFLSANG